MSKRTFCSACPSSRPSAGGSLRDRALRVPAGRGPIGTGGGGTRDRCRKGHSAAPALQAGRRQEILYVTERCVFRLDEDRLALVEVAPGIDVEKDILQRLPFKPAVDR